MWLRLSSAGIILASSVTFAGPPPPARSGLTLTYFDRSVRPQDDLFGYVNGRWIATARLAGDEVFAGGWAELSERTEQTVRSIAEDAASAPFGSPLRQIGDLYTSALDEPRLEALGVTPIRAQLDRFEAIGTRKALAAEAGHLTAMLAGGPFGGDIVTDAENAAQIFVEIRQGGTLLPRRADYLDPDPVSAERRRRYETYLVRLFTLAGRLDAAAAGRSVLDFETALARIQLAPAASREAARSAPRRTLPELELRMPGFDWLAWAQPPGFDRASGIVLLQPSFFRGFAALVARTPLDILKNWLTARHLDWSASYLTPAFAEARFEFFGRAITGQRRAPERWRTGVTLVNSFLGDAVGRRYVERHLSPRTRAAAERLVRELVAAYRELIDEATWLAPATRREARAKLSRTRLKIGAPKRWREYGDLLIKPDDLFGNVIRGRSADNRFRLLHLVGQADPDEWLAPPQTLNAFYLPGLNEMTLPAALLQPPLFDAEVDDAANYGALGALVGHELSHALGGRGRPYDAKGAIRHWWTASDLETLERAGRLVSQQFGSYWPIAGAPVNGDLTRGENLADVNGLSIAFRAYQRSLGGRPAPVIDGFTGAQRFFLSWAAIWRIKVRDDYLRQWLLTLSHPPNPYRANGPVGHLQAFYDAFGVTEGDRLFRAPARRVRLW